MEKVACGVPAHDLAGPVGRSAVRRLYKNSSTRCTSTFAVLASAWLTAF
jgi:hypothetical protein